MLILAAASEGMIPDPMEPVILFLAGFTALGTAMMLAFNLFDRFSGRAKERQVQQPFVVRAEAEMLSRKEHASLFEPVVSRVATLESEVRLIRLKMDADKMEIISAGEDRLCEIRAEINDVRKDIAATPAQMFALLKATKGLIPNE